MTATADYAELADADLVIEAVFEEIEVKRAVFARLATACRPDAILATNTSYLDPRLIAEGLPGPDRFIGQCSIYIKLQCCHIVGTEHIFALLCSLVISGLRC